MEKRLPIVVAIRLPMTTKFSKVTTKASKDSSYREALTGSLSTFLNILKNMALNPFYIVLGLKCHLLQIDMDLKCISFSNQDSKSKLWLFEV